MTTFHALVFLLSFFALWFLFARQSACVCCNGRGAHRRDCPLVARDEDEGD